MTQGHNAPLDVEGPTSFAIIIGGMKCGTTSLFDLLAQHPEVAPSRLKEPDFFVTEPDPCVAWDRYVALWDWDPARHKVAIEASTAYAKYPWVKDVPEKFAACSGRSFKFIYMLRDPVTRIASQVRHSIYGGWGRSLDDEGLTDDLIDFSRYAMQADRYRALFPPENLLLLTLEEMRDAPEAVLRRVCAFLGISTDHRFADSEEPRNTGDFYSVPPLVASLAKNRALKWLVDHLLPRGARHRLRRMVARSSAGKKPIGRWQLDAEEVARVKTLLRDDMARLREDYGIDAPWMT